MKNHNNKGLKEGLNLTFKQKKRLCDSKIRIKNLKLRTQDVHEKCENRSLLC
jgi:hypothetical protein